jgi:polysaccharide deacetylase 2 family uncharacterized protein YibQ
MKARRSRGWSGLHRLTREERAGLRGRRPKVRLRFDADLRALLLKGVGGAAGVAVLILALSQLLGGGGAGRPGPAEGLPEAERSAWSTRLEAALKTAAGEQGLRQEWVVTTAPGTPGGDSLLTVVEFKVPGDLHLEVLNLALTRAVQEQGGEVVRGVERSDSRVELEVAWRTHPTHRLVLQRYSRYRRVEGRLALIIDDWGRSEADLLASFAALGAPWTASVIPGQPRTGDNARALTDRGIPLMIHLPMQPENGEVWDLGEQAVYVGTDSERMEELLSQSLREVPGARGLNNHMGSRATADETTMRTFMQVLHRHDLFFVDSVTTAASTAAEQARREGIPWTKRDLFIDPQDDPVVITQQLQLAVEQARRQKSVVLIGHPRRNTLIALQRWIPEVRNAGFEFVTVEHLLQSGGRNG